MLTITTKSPAEHSVITPSLWNMLGYFMYLIIYLMDSQLHVKLQGL